jgi:hypothetical protein
MKIMVAGKQAGCGRFTGEVVSVETYEDREEVNLVVRPTEWKNWMRAWKDDDGFLRLVGDWCKNLVFWKEV